MNYWHNTILRELLLEAESKVLNTVIQEVGGSSMLTVGSASCCELQLISSIPNQFCRGRDFGCSLDELPFLANSTDLIIAPHLLELVAEPKKALHEIYQILVPGGKVVIVGFNPFSLWGLARRWKGANKNHWHRYGKVKHWLRELQFVVLERHGFLYRPPVANKEALRRMLCLEKVGQQLWSYMGSIYIVVAEKRILGVTPLLAGTVESTTRNI